MSVVALAATGFGDISVGNPSFDEGDLSIGTYTYDYAPWTTGNGSGWIGNGYYAGAPAGDGWYFVLQSGTVVSQTLDATFVEGVTYDFNIDVGTYIDEQYDWEIFIFDATAGNPATPLSSINGHVIGGIWYNQTVSYRATPAEAGHAIGIGFTGEYYALFDHASVAVAGAEGEVVITSNPVDVVVNETRTAVFTVGHVNGTSYEWHKVGEGIIASGDTESGETVTLTINDVSLSDSGYYFCRVMNDKKPEGADSDQAHLTVTELTCGDWGYLRADINKDCYVDIHDLVELAEKWLNGPF